VCYAFLPGGKVATEENFKTWAKAPGQTELEKCDNAVTAVRKAVAASTDLSKHNISVFAQGSYCNRTNVREDSDVDVCVLCTDSMYCDYPPDKGASDFNIESASYPYQTFKNDVGTALTAYFKGGHVTRGNKAFDIKENTYRIAADAVPCFEHKRFYENGTWVKPTGTAFVPDNNIFPIKNWPEQNYNNGVTKNTATGGRFKDVVRILKRLRYKMCDENIAAAHPVPSFLCECLVWNAPDDSFRRDTLRADTRAVLAHLFNNTMDFEQCKEWGEINELKYLFRDGQPWTMKQAHDFISAVWDYLEFK
jgi:hypothetical protein